MIFSAELVERAAEVLCGHDAAGYYEWADAPDWAKNDYRAQVYHVLAVVEQFDSFDCLVQLAQGILDRRYPADIPLLCDRDSPDPGPRLAAALRDVLAVIERRE